MISKKNSQSSSNFFIDNAINAMLEKWPSGVVARHEVGSFSGGAISPGTCANLDSAGLGCKDQVVLGRKVVYVARSFAEWLVNRENRGVENDQRKNS